MNNSLKNLLQRIVVISGTLVLSYSFCHAEEEPVEVVKESTKKIKKPKKRNNKLSFRNLDTNNDREISLKEFTEYKKLSIEKEFDRIDRDQDGAINRKEFLRMKKEKRLNKKRTKRD